MVYKRIMIKNHIAEYPKVSIITCVYNGEKYISKLLGSVLNMGYPNIEHIIVNDGSTDSTENIVMKYAELYKNKENASLYIKYIKQKNMGLGGATNTGLKQITGEYWTWINCDDWYEKDAFFEPIEIMRKKTKIDYVQMNGWRFFNNQKEIIFKKNNLHFKKKHTFFVEYIKQEEFKFTLYICRTSSYRIICPSLTIYPSKFTQDVQFANQLFPCLKGTFVKSPKWYFLVRDDNLWSVVRNEKKDLWVAIQKSVEFLSIPHFEKQSIINAHIYYSLYKKYVIACKNHAKKDAFYLYKELKALKKTINPHLYIHLHKKTFLRLLLMVL